MKKTLALVLSTAMLLSMAACGGGTETTDTGTSGEGSAAEESSGESTGGTVESMVVVLPNVRGDGGTHDLACQAAEQIAEDTGIELKIVEMGTAVVDSAKWEAGMADLCEEGYDLVIAGGSLMKDTIQAVAPEYPDIPFICYDMALDFDTVDMPNVYGVDFHQNEAGYMAGVVAASMTESGYIGYVGATKIPTIYDFLVGYIEGAQAVDPDIHIAVAWTNDYNDATLAKELALAQISDGADVVFPACGNAAAGVYAAARDQNVWAIGNDQDVAAKYAASDESIQQRILASVMKKVDNAVRRAYDEYIEGTLPFGTQETIGVAEDGVGIVKNEYYEETVPEDVRNTVTEYEEKITSGEVEVSTAIGMSAEDIEAMISSAQ